MSNKDIIKKALLLNNVCKNDITVVKTENHHYIVHIFEMLVLLLFNFFLANEIKQEEQYKFIMKNFKSIVDIVITEIEILLLAFDNLYEEKLTDVVEFHNKDECLLIVAIQNKINRKLMKG